ncbi:MAG: hypothetical protein JRN44_00520 [Nitrososphaerota archaeon]|nr:hypothetical protein [Nitrososphaerota archaeon]MDG6941838.1 hypothetical protein [Nitrososphaerota archaeon]MDG6946989.1 hypothetical protein [Nitrososphaerota archaeon]MDG6950599.1 hypothetical protein [Nitrososphaerota archaeon]
MAQDKQTINVLVLELATMVVAISLAFTTTFVATFDLNSVVSYIFTNIIVIWFWWGYVVDRLAYPPKTMNFPILDIFILILISLIPFTLKLGGTSFIAGVVGMIIIVWAFLINFILREYRDEMSYESRASLQSEVRQRLTIGPIFVFDAGLTYLTRPIGLTLFDILVLALIAWSASNRRKAGRAPIN